VGGAVCFSILSPAELAALLVALRRDLLSLRSTKGCMTLPTAFFMAERARSRKFRGTTAKDMSFSSRSRMRFSGFLTSI